MVKQHLEIAAKGGLSSLEDKEADTALGEVVDNALPLVGTDLAVEVRLSGVPRAVCAIEVAAARDFQVCEDRRRPSEGCFNTASEVMESRSFVIVKADSIDRLDRMC